MMDVQIARFQYEKLKKGTYEYIDMELEVKESDKNKLVMAIKGEDHTFCNVLVKRLQQNSDVKVAVYKIDHPLTRVPTLMVETSTGDPKKAIQGAIKELEKEFKSFQKSFDKAA
jgi:DNA-directed RNA polymerase subunit L